MPPTFTWLHFSDLHWGTDAIKNYWPTIKENLYKDIRTLTKNELKVDALFFTGDLVNRGKEFVDFNEKFLKDLEDVLKNEGMDPIFLPVPGNHDLVRPSDDNDSAEMIKEKWDTREDIRERIWKKKNKTGTWGVLQEAFANYMNWLNESDRPFPLPAGFKSGLLPGDFTCTIPLERGYSAGVIGLNSAFLQLREGDYEGKLDLHVAQLQELCDGDHTAWFKQHSLFFLMTHHPVNWLSSRGREEYTREINRDGRFLYHLCGHMHKNSFTQWKEGFNQTSWKLWMGSSLFSRESYVIDWGAGHKAGVERRHGYSLGTLELDSGQGKIWPRTTNSRRIFVVDTEIATEKSWVDVTFPVPEVEIGSSAAGEKSGSASSEKSFLPPSIPKEYRKYILDHCRYMDINMLRSNSKILHLSLPEVYVPLYTSTGHTRVTEEGGVRVTEGGNFRETEETTINIESLLEKEDVLVLRGEAGSGKSTLIKHLAYSIINEENQQGLNDYLPVYILLKDIKSLFTLEETACFGAGMAEKILEELFNAKGCGLGVVELIKKFRDAEKILLLIDGLDEIPREYRKCVVESFHAFLLPCNKYKVVYSGRPHGIEGALINYYGKQVIDILPYNNDQVEEFVSRWWTVVHNEEHECLKNGSPIGLIEDLNANTEIDELKRNPLMLTAICFLYLDQKKLPEQRADLYKRFVDRLLDNRFSSEDIKMKSYFMKLAYEMFMKGDKGADRVDALNLFRGFFQEKGDVPEHRLSVETLFDLTEGASGLLRREKGSYTFTHLSLQEYLTAAYIIDTETDQVEAIVGYATDPRWRNVIRLHVGLLSINSSNTANKIVKEILRKNEKHETWILGGEALLDIHKDCRRDGVAVVKEKMQEIIETGTAPTVLVSAGEILGRLGDPRDLKAFVEIKGGTYNLEIEGKQERKFKKFKVKDFQLGKYPVTNSWYEEFTEAGGYENREYWSSEGWTWKEKEEIKEQYFRYDRRFNCPNAPVVGISLYEAEAFTVWLTKSREDDFTYRLPGEWEWQLAAAGREGNIYPWGNEWDENRCNSGELKIGRPSSVGVFHSGDTPGGREERKGVLSDMAGNVWEWTADQYEKYKGRYILRGGSFVSSRAYCRCAYRSNHFPGSGDDDLGFRCART